MSESVNQHPVGAPVVTGPTPAQLQSLKEWLAQDSSASDDAGRIDRIRALEEIKHAASAAQANEAVRFKVSQLAAQQAAGVRRRRLGEGITERSPWLDASPPGARPD